jgi:hypothetical protein
MYRSHEPLPERPSDDASLPGDEGGARKFSPVPLGVFAGVAAVVINFMAMFFLGWALAPTSVGCGVTRAFTISGAMVAASLVIYSLTVGLGLSIMREAHESQLRRRSFVLITTTIFVLGAIPIFAMAALLGSCFDF